MSLVVIEWLVVLVCLLLFVGAIVADIIWLVKKGWATAGKATAFVLLTDIIGAVVGGLLVGVIFFVGFMMVMGPAGRGSDAPEWAYILCIILAVIIPPVLLIGLKRLFLFIFKIGSGMSAWVYSVVASVLTILVVLAPPPLFYYLMTGPLGFK